MQKVLATAYRSFAVSMLLACLAASCAQREPVETPRGTAKADETRDAKDSLDKAIKVIKVATDLSRTCRIFLSCILEDCRKDAGRLKVLRAQVVEEAKAESTRRQAGASDSPPASSDVKKEHDRLVAQMGADFKYAADKYREIAPAITKNAEELSSSAKEVLEEAARLQPELLRCAEDIVSLQSALRDKKKAQEQFAPGATAYAEARDEVMKAEVELVSTVHEYRRMNYRISMYPLVAQQLYLLATHSTAVAEDALRLAALMDRACAELRQPPFYVEADNRYAARLGPPVPELLLDDIQDPLNWKPEHTVVAVEPAWEKTMKEIEAIEEKWRSMTPVIFSTPVVPDVVPDPRGQ